MKGLSIQSGLALGGLFQDATKFNPFEKMGYFLPSLDAVQLDATTITTAIKTSVGFSNYVNGFVATLGNKSGVGASSLYITDLSDNSVIDYSDKIDQNTGGAVTHEGMTVYDGRIIYAQGSSLRSNQIIPTVAEDKNILTSASTGGNQIPVRFCVGVDGYLYYTNNSATQIGKIVLSTGTSGNVANAFSTQYFPKDITKDEQYNIFITDNNLGYLRTLTGNCKVFFWDGIKPKADVIYDIPDSYLISCRYVNGKVIILGASGIWICNSLTPPRLIFPLTDEKLPLNANAVTVSGQTLYWASKALGGKVYAYGSPVGNPIVYCPFQSSQSDRLNTSLCSSGDYFVVSTDAGTSTPGVFLLNSGTTRVISSISTVATQLPQTYSFSYAKVVLRRALTVGESLSLGIYTAEGGVIMNTQTISYATVGAKQVLIFNPYPIAGSSKYFDNIYFSLSSSEEMVQRVSIYGVPVNDYSQK
jgi:hypothetical protein